MKRSIGLAMILAMGCGSKVSVGSGAPGASGLDGAGGGEPVPMAAIPTGKVDLLFVVDNSIGMYDAADNFALAIPPLLRSLTSENPGLDVHVAVVTSSLGSQGTSACDPAIANVLSDDHGRLLPRTQWAPGSYVALNGYQLGKVERPTCPTLPPEGVVAWKSGDDRDAFEIAASCVALGALSTGQVGCGYEMPLEAAYRFLVDPAPPASIATSCTFTASGDTCKGDIVASGVDEMLLAQRAKFLRADSTLVVVLLGDENDGSLDASGSNWLPFAVTGGAMLRGSTGCASVPDDVELSPALLRSTYGCWSCAEDPSDPNCSTPWPTGPGLDGDSRSLRVFQQVQRFGRDFLYPHTRYVAAFSARTLVDRQGKPFANPLFAAGQRTRGNVVFAPIVGVPKTLVSDDAGHAKSLTAADWETIASADLSRRSPYMIESIAPRTGIPHYAGDRAIDATNGGELPIATGDDLQFACIAPRRLPDPGEYCYTPSADKTSSLCNATDMQAFYGARPGLRQLRVARDLGASGLVMSICEPDLSRPFVSLKQRIQSTLR